MLHRSGPIHRYGSKVANWFPRLAILVALPKLGPLRLEPVLDNVNENVNDTNFSGEN